ncbi:MAG TPA: UDP-2,3-diacylglucosamine diphosphatase [Synergistaceae bacterium]|nr:UDP-2,3-diacylglucosamine diphosphatase [Synergistaceae bacterium]HPJ25997.1 UDP-2,3-diacylglucosamine diphosphatase [Synergistaceae bacterium]HPQ37305.1 UDP-2,3-diacylglucosamine diphosphatase [Synergistaceae bacterium]
MQTYRSVFLSDMHLGTRWCKARDLASFLSAISCERLYLVGDIIDGWKLQRKSSWPRSHNRVLQELLRISRKSSVIYVTGNHDSFLDEYHGSIFGNIGIYRQAIHKTLDGKKMLVMHGDEFDAVMNHGKWLARLGDVAYDGALWLNYFLNGVRSFFGMRYWSLSQFLKHKVKDAVNFIGEFEKHLAEEMRRQKLDGVICGHIHRPALKRLQEGLYANCGDWVESCSALVEHLNGEFEILHWHEEKDRFLELPRVTAQGELVLPENFSPEEIHAFENLWSLPK